MTGKKSEPPIGLGRDRSSQAKAALAASNTAHNGGPGSDARTALTEVTGRRTATSSTFQNPDGTKTMRIYNRPVHYKKTDGSWADIDTGLMQQRDGRWTEAANSQQLSFAAVADSTTMVDWSIDADHRLSYGLQGVHPAKAKVKADTLTYPGAAPATDIEYKALATGIKESLVLHDSSAQTSWVFPLRVTNARRA